MVKRKPGSRKTDLSSETSPKVLKTSKSLVRTDWGGQDPEKQIRKRAKEMGIDFGPKSCDLVKKLCEEQVESCRKRAFPRIDEVIRRLEGKDPPFEESSP